MNCYYCNEPLTSDDYKLDKVIKSFSGQVCHEKCFDKQNVADCFPDYEMEAVDRQLRGEEK